MTNQNGVKCYKSLSCIISVLVIVFIFGAIIIDLAWTKPSIRQDISEINKELVVINSQIDRMDSLQTSTNQRFLEILENNHKVKLTQNPQPSDTITKHWNSIPSRTKVYSIVYTWWKFKDTRDNYKRRVQYTRTYACGLPNCGWIKQYCDAKKQW